MPRNRVLLFGATGALGTAISETYKSHGWQVFPVVRQSTGLVDEVLLPLEDSKEFENAIVANSFDSVVFAQGINMNGSIMTTEEEDFQRLFDVNVTFIVRQVKLLMEKNAIATEGKIVVVSSLAEVFTRREKFAYTVSKAAVGGLVRSLAVDLGRSHRILVNAVLPGVVDTPMSRKGLTSDQIANVIDATPIGTLVTPTDVGNSVYSLGSELNTGVSGQSLLVDNAFSVTFLP
ncbi:MAG TPA: SDR family oxidoreductase [Candidatus Paceibacterota bacterium]|nr:SDR family oxidoreductase [Candidatus Paceibacterota bacterium]